MRLYRSNFERVLLTAQAVCAVIFLIALAASKYRNDVLLAQPSVLPAVSNATPTPQATSPQTALKPYPPNNYKQREEGYVPDSATAIKIAEAVWIPIYGKETLRDEKPFKARLVNGVWIVDGTLPKGARGGTAYAEISKESGCILKVTHYK